jgi:hypothetical protein
VVEVLVGVVAAAAGLGTVWGLSRLSGIRERKLGRARENGDGDTVVLRRLKSDQSDESRQHLREHAEARAAARRRAAQAELNVLAGEGRVLVERAERWKENDERAWREDFAEFSQRLREAAHKLLAPSTAMTVDLECKAVRQASWPSHVSVTETAAGQLTLQRGTLVQAMDTLLRTLAAAIDVIVQTELPAVAHEPGEPQIGAHVDVLVLDAKQILGQLARSVVVSEYELWTLVHEWRDRMVQVLTEQGAQDAAKYIAAAPPSKHIPFVQLVASMVPGQLQPMRQLAGWLERLNAWQRENAPRGG